MRPGLPQFTGERFGAAPDALPRAAAEHLAIDQPGTRFSSVVMGANTHTVGLPDLPSPYPHLEQVVFTHRALAPAENLRATSEDPVTIIRAMKQARGGDIWLCGGGVFAAQLRDEIDRLVLKRQPALFGGGAPRSPRAPTPPRRPPRPGRHRRGPVRHPDHDVTLGSCRCPHRGMCRRRRIQHPTIARDPDFGLLVETPGF